ADGWAVTLVGLSSQESSCEPQSPVGRGSLEIFRVHRRTYQKHKLISRIMWTIVSNISLLIAAFKSMWQAESVLFTGSPPFMVHFIVPINALLRKKLIYRITDFHPECLIAERGRAGVILKGLLWLTQFWRCRVDEFEVLGLDQERRLIESG